MATKKPYGRQALGFVFFDLPERFATGVRTLPLAQGKQSQERK
ncbi:MAG TPA: hypothetical protein VGJ26_16935 [Pirellulales bacterium]